MRAQPVLRLGVGALAAALLVSCSHAKPATLNTPRVEREIHAWATDVKVVPTPVVKCLSSVPIKVDATFACTVTGGGRSIDLEVKIRNTKGEVTFHIV